jgi:hypothetical protein
MLQVLIELFWNIRDGYPIQSWLVWTNQRMCQPLSKIQPLVEYGIKTVRSGPWQVTTLERGRAYKMYHCIWLVKCWNCEKTSEQPVSHLCAFLCLGVQWEPFPSALFAPFTSCNSQSVFTDVVKDWLTMHFSVLPMLHEPSPLGGEASKRKVHNRSNHWMTWQQLATNLEKQLGNMFKWMWLGGLMPTPTTLNTDLLDLVHSMTL